MKKMIRVSPVTDVDMFTFNTNPRDVLSSNFLENSEKLHKHALTAYGDLGKIIKLMEYPTIERTVIDPTDDEFVGMTAGRIRKLQSTLDIEWIKEKKKLKENKTKFFGFLMQLLSEDGEEKIRNNVELWEEIEQQCDPLRLWRAIVTTHGLRNDDMSIMESRRSARVGYQKCFQVNGETLLKFSNRFRQCISILTAVGETVPGPATSAVDFLEGLDKRIYGEMLRDLKNRVRNSEATFPINFNEAHSYARNYIPPYTRRPEANQKGVYLTHGQDVSDNKDSKVEPSITKTKTMCPDCGRSHYGVCWGKNRERSPFGNNPKVVTFIDADADNNKKLSEASSDDESSPYFSGDISAIVYKCNKQLEKGNTSCDGVVYLDSCANTHVFSNTRLLSNIHKTAENSIVVKGVGGSMHLDKVGTVPYFGLVHIMDSNENRINLLSLGLVKDMYEVTLEDDDFVVHIQEDNKKIRFTRRDDDLWGCDSKEIMIKDVLFTNKIINTDTVADRESKFSGNEVRKARQARDIMKQLGYPSSRDMIKMIVKGMMINIPITAKYVIRANDIYGPDVASLKGKTVKKKCKKSKEILIPRSMKKKQDLYTDMFYWRGQGFMLSMAMPLGIRFITPVTKPETTGYLKTLLEGHTGRMKSHDFDVRCIHVDPQKSIAALDGKIDCTMDISGARQHVSIIERSIRTVKERMRSIENGLYFKCPRRFIKGLGYSAVEHINMFPRSDQKDEVSPRELFTGIKLDYNRDVRNLAFGSYVQAHEDFDNNTNLPRERTRGCIALYPKCNSAGSWKFYSLKTNLEITRDNWTSLPAPDVVIDRVNTLYEADEKVFDILSDENKDDVNIDHTSFNVDDLIESEILNETEQFEPDGIDQPNDKCDEVEYFEVEHEEEHIDNVDKKQRAIDAIHRRFGNVSIDNIDKKQRALDAIHHRFGNINDTSAINDESQTLPNAEESAEEYTPVDNADLKNTAVPLGSVSIDGVRRSSRVYNKQYVNMMQKTRHTRVIRRPNPDRFVFAMTRTQAYKRYATEAEAAAIKEMTQIYDRGTLRIIDKKMMTLPQLRRLIRSGMIFDDKYDMNGVFERLKGRLVARGNEMDDTLYEDRSSPTISTIHVMMILAVAAKERRHIRILDIGNAFLEAEMKSGEDVYVELDKVSSRILSMLDKSIIHLIGEDGKYVAKLDKALYGCIQSAKLWFDKLTNVLKKYGFTTNPCDGCVMNMEVNGKQVTIGFHVDDLLITCEDNKVLDDIVNYLRSEFREVKEKNEDTMGYLGMKLTTTDTGILLDMNVYTANILTEYNITGSAATPATDDLFNDRECEILSDEERKVFHSCVAKLLYLAKRTRPDILLTVSHLASRVSVANKDDNIKLNRLLRYINGHKNMSLHFRRDSDLAIHAYIDASFAIHSNGTSRTGMVIELGGATICAWTSKQKMVTKSSCEAELVGLSDGSSEVLGCREFMQYQGYDVGPAIIYQDNTSVIDLIKAGRPTSHRTRHLKARYFFIKDYIDAGEIEIKHMGTDWMLADYLTKPLGGEKFIQFRNTILGIVPS